MTDKPDNPPAFPLKEPGQHDDPGMTLRARIAEGDEWRSAANAWEQLANRYMARAEAAEAELAQWRDGKMSTAEDAATHLKMLNDIACLHARAEAAEAECNRLTAIYKEAVASSHRWQERAILAEVDNARLREALVDAEKMFRWYGDLHAKKTPPDTDKAARNYGMADKCAAALGDKT